MSLLRISPLLLIKNTGLVKTVSFKNPVYIGDPINAVRIFNEKEVDELTLLDIYASLENRGPSYELIKDIVSESFMPISYGGGVKNLEQMNKIFSLGVEKVVLNSAALDFDLIKEASAMFGSQSIVVCIDARRAIFGGYSSFILGGTKKINFPPDILAQKAVDAGAGEIIIQSIDKDGTMKGLDLSLISMISNAVNVPVVAAGGAGTLDHLKEAVIQGGASAVAAGSLFIYRGKHKAVLINYPSQEVINQLFNSEL